MTDLHDMQCGELHYSLKDYGARDMKEEEFWQGRFGDEYAKRNMKLESTNLNFFAKALRRTESLSSIIEFGAGTGQNTAALAALRPEAQLWAVELNKKAADHIGIGNVIIGNALNATIPTVCDLAFTKGLMIHIHPDNLLILYDQVYNATRDYILICEYYNPTPVEVEYRGHAGKLWKRDFAGEMLDIYPNLRLIDYGFVYHRDTNPQDDLSWFLMRKL